MMTYRNSFPLKQSRRVITVIVVLCLCINQSWLVGGVCFAANQTNQSDAKEQAADKEVLKLQAEKQDSIDRLKNNAAEIARKWRARQAQGQRLQGDKSEKFDSGPDKSMSSSGASDVEQQPSPAKSDQTLPEESFPSVNQIPSGTDAVASEMNATNTGADSMMSPAGSADQLNLENDPAVQAVSLPSIVDGPIDRLALATSLYATDQFRECLKILEAVELRPLSVEDRQWHDYLAASSYRKLGDQAEAEDHYRSVLQRSTSTWVSTAARWWLGHMDEITQLELKIQQVQNTIENWRKEIDVLKSPN